MSTKPCIIHILHTRMEAPGVPLEVPLVGSLELHDRTRCKTMVFLSRAGIPSMFTLLHQHHVHWLGHIHRMEDGHIPKDLLYGELATWAKCRGHLQLHFKDVCKHDMKTCNINIMSWVALQTTEPCGSSKCHKGLKRGQAVIQQKTVKDGPGEQPVNSRTIQTHIRHLSLHAMVAAGIGNPGLASTATQDDANQ